MIDFNTLRYALEHRHTCKKSALAFEALCVAYADELVRLAELGAQQEAEAAEALEYLKALTNDAD